MMLLKPGDPVWRRAGYRGCPEPSSLFRRGEMGAEWDPPAPRGTLQRCGRISRPLLSPCLPLFFTWYYFFAPRTGRTKPAASSPIPRCCLESPQTSSPVTLWGWRPPLLLPGNWDPLGMGTHIITLSHWHSELPVPGQGACG